MNQKTKKQLQRLAALLLCALLLTAFMGCGESQELPADETEQLFTLQGDFQVKGRQGKLLTAALERMGISPSKEGAEKTVYVGAHDNPLTQAAEEKLKERAQYYNDFVILCNGSDVAIAGGSEDAISRGVTYFTAQYVKDGAISLSPELCHVDRAENLSLTVGGRSLQGLTVVAKDEDYRFIAAELAVSLSRLTGYPVKDAASAGAYSLLLTAETTAGGDRGEVTTAYTVSVSDSQLSIIAPTKAALSYGAQHFVSTLSNGLELAEGLREERTYDMKHIKATDTETFKYCGMWQDTDPAHPDAMVSYWNTAYVEMDFTGTAITVDFTEESTFKIKMDDSTYSSPYTVKGAMTFYAEGDGTHTLRIYNDDRMKHISFGGASVESHAALTRTPDRTHYIQFIGDSITNKMATLSHMVWDSHGWDFAASAYSGMALEDNYGFWSKNNGYKNNAYTEGSMADLIHRSAGVTTIGMETAFFKLGVPDDKMQGEEREAYGSGYYTSAFDCKYESGNAPDVVFSFLGTNDELHRISNGERFTQAYVKFVERIIATYGGDIQIVVLQAISNGTYDPNQEHSYYSCIAEAGEELERRFPNNVTFIDRDVIEGWAVEISSDNIHPTQNGYYTLANRIGETLETLLSK